MNVPYRFVEGRNDSSDIDIVAIHPLDGRCISCEVKGWHRDTMVMSWWRTWPLLNFTTEAADRAVRELVGDQRVIDHVLVVPPISERQRADIEAHAASNGVTLLEWPRLLADLVRSADLVRHSRDQTTHVIRVLRVHGLLGLPSDA